MVDYESYFQYGPADGRNGPLQPANSGTGCACSDCEANEGLMKKYRARFDTQSSVKAKEWEEEQYLICPPRVLGYILQEKQWAQLQVTSLSEIPKTTPQESALNQRIKLADDDLTSPDMQSRLRKKNARGTHCPVLMKTDMIAAYCQVRHQHESVASRPGQKPYIYDNHRDQQRPER